MLLIDLRLKLMKKTNAASCATASYDVTEIYESFVGHIISARRDPPGSTGQYGGGTQSQWSEIDQNEQLWVLFRYN